MDPYIADKKDWKPVLFPHRKRLQVFWEMHLLGGLGCMISNYASASIFIGHPGRDPLGLMVQEKYAVEFSRAVAETVIGSCLCCAAQTRQPYPSRYSLCNQYVLLLWRLFDIEAIRTKFPLMVVQLDCGFLKTDTRGYSSFVLAV